MSRPLQLDTLNGVLLGPRGVVPEVRTVLTKSVEPPSWLPGNGTELTVSPGTQWVCLEVRPRQEFSVATAVLGLSVPYFLPTIVRWHRTAAGPRKRHAPLFPGYVFCRVGPTILRTVTHLRGVVRVHIPDQASVLPELNDLAAVLRSSDAAFPQFRAGDEVEVVSGALKGVVGTVASVPSPAGNSRPVRLVLDVDLIGERVRVEVDQTDTKVTRSAYSTRQEEIAEQLVALTAAVDSELIKYLARHPRRLYDIDARKFEELVAELLRDMGYDVMLTPFRADGGRDVLAVFKVPAGEVLTVVECKRFAANRHIGPDLVQRLLWIADRYDKASRAMLATTTYFSSGARDLEREFRWRVGLKDFDAVTDWLGKYGRWHQEPSAGIWIPEGGIGAS